MKVLLIEDNASDIQAFQDSVAVWNIGKSETIEVEDCKTLDGALMRLSSAQDLVSFWI